MRVLCSTTAGAGHFGPLVPFARACVRAGHDVLVAAPASFAAAVADAGFEHAPFDDVPPDVMGAVFARLPSMSNQEANATVVREVFARLDAHAALPGVTAVVDSWQPDLVLREPTEFASWVVAERAGVPQVEVAIGVAALGEMMLPLLAEPLAELRRLAGLGADPDLAHLRDVPRVSMVPPGFDTISPPAEGPWRFRDSANGDATGGLPAPWGDADAPLVYVTFGSVTGSIGPFGAVYPTVVDALADAPFRVLLTTGEGFDPATLEPLPPNVHVERWWPQADVMPNCAAVVGHGGFGTTMTALAAGVPQVVVPLFASDQFVNGERVAATGVGRCVEGGVEGVAVLADAVHGVIDEPSYRAAAGRIAGEIAGLPDVAGAVELFHRIAAGDVVSAPR